MIASRPLMVLSLALGVGLGAYLLTPLMQGPIALYTPLGGPAADAPSPAHGAPSWGPELREFVDTHRTDASGHLTLVAHDLSTNELVSIDGDQPMYLASGMKMLFLIELFRQRDAGLLSFDETLLYTWNDVRDGAPAMNRHDVGSRHRIGTLIEYMIRDSDNSATDLLLRRIGTRNVERTLYRIVPEGGFGPVVNLLDVRLATYGALDERAPKLKRWQIRDVRWRNAHHPRLDLLKKHIGAPYGAYGRDDLNAAYTQYYSSGRNHASMRAAASVFAALTEGRAVSPQTDKEILSVLEGAYSSGHRIRGAIPSAYNVAHKTGTQHQRVCDLALIALPGGDHLILTIAVENGEHEAMEHYLQKVARFAWDLAASTRDAGAKGLAASGSGQNASAGRKW